MTPLVSLLVTATMVRGRNAATAAAPNQEQDRRDEEEEPCNERQVERVPHYGVAAISFLLYALLDDLEERDVEYEYGERGGAGKAAEAGAAAVRDGCAEESEEGKGEGDEGDAEGDDVQDEDLGERRRDGVHARGQRRGEAAVDELRRLREIVPDMRWGALQPAPVLQVGTEAEGAEVDEWVRLVDGRRGRRPVPQVDAQEVHGLEVRDVEGDHAEERGRAGDGDHAEDFVPGYHCGERANATERREKEVGNEIRPVLRQ